MSKFPWTGMNNREKDYINITFAEITPIIEVKINFMFLASMFEISGKTDTDEVIRLCYVEN